MYRTPSGDRASSSPNTRIVVVGGGFGGAYVVRHLERLFRSRPDVEIVLVSRDNFFLMTPLLFEACSGTLDFRHCSVPIRDFLRRAVCRGHRPAYRPGEARGSRGCRGSGL